VHPISFVAILIKIWYNIYMSIEYPKIPRLKEEDKKREEKREELKKILPVDLQLKIGKKNDWQFEGELVKRRHSEIDEDKIFFEAINIINKQDFNQLKEIQEETKEKRKEIIIDLENILEIKQVMQKCLDKNWLEAACNIAIALADKDLQLTKQVLQKCLDKNELYLAHDIAIALADKDPEASKQVMQICLNENKLDSARDIAIALADKDPEASKQVMQICLNENKLNSASRITIALADKDPEIAKQVMQICLDKNELYSASEIAIALADKDPEIAKQVMQICLDKNDLHLANGIAIALADKDPQLTKQVLQICLDKNALHSANDIAIALVDKDPQLTKQVLQICLDKNALHSAHDITIALADKDPETVKQTMQQFLDKNELDLAHDIATALSDKDPKAAKQVMKKCLDKNDLLSARDIAIALADKDPEASKQVMKKCLDKNDLLSARDIAIALADKDPEASKQVMQICLNENELGLASQIAVKLADKDPKAAKQIMQQFLDKNDLYSARDIAVVLAKNLKLTSETERLLKTINELTDYSYGEIIVANLLIENKDLSLFQEEYLPQYLTLKKIAEQVNNNIEESKKWKDPQDFFDKHAENIALLQIIDLNLTTQMFKNHLHRGLSLADSYLTLFQPILDNKEITQSIKQYIDTHNDLNGYNFSDLLEIGTAYDNLNDVNLFKESIELNKDKNFEQLKSLLNKNLLKKLADSLHLEVEIKDQDLSQWKIKYLSNLITNQELLKKQGDRENIKMANALLKAVLENRFDDFITNINQSDRIGKEIAYHNQQVKKAFNQANINWDNWLHFDQSVILNVNTQKKQDREALFNQFEQRFLNWQSTINEYEPRLKSSLNKDLTLLNQKKKEFNPSKIDLHDPLWLEQLLPTYTKSLKYLQSKDPNFTLPSQILESFDHLVETIKTLTTQQQQDQTNSKDFYVQLWDRDPRKDLFQGNYTHCCIAVGVKEAPPGANTYTTHHPETIFQYLIDQGINVAEIVDPETKDVIAQTWLFVSLAENQQPILVADNFEVNNRYPAGHNVNRAIRESMFEFLNQYANSCHISKVVLGKVFTNDIETNDLKSIHLPPINKLGGYFNDDEYYLETLDHTTALDITKKIIEKIDKKYKIEIIENINQKILEDILKVEEASFSEEMQSDLDDLKDTLKNKKGIQLIVRNDQDKIVSYLSSKPLEDAYKELSVYDKELKPESGVLYVESIATDPRFRNAAGFLEMINILAKEAKQKGYKKIAAHVRVDNHLSEIFQQREGAKKIRRIENWYNFDEPFDYLEIEI